mmetsp:Transcript_15940/g.24018  ORF Transcript_15940/g.24018 Transcript_15940/m.24018 type:complete len:1009 (-) Transcript_15940:20-3046(-)
MDVIEILSHDPQVLGYFLVLGVSMIYCFSHSKKKWASIVSLGAMSVTWYYILRWTLHYKRNGGMNLFDDAYIDVVIPPYWGVSSQLLTWVVVASVWMHEASPFYMMFGMLGAMSAAFITWVPNKPKSSRHVPLIFVPSSILSLLAISKLPTTLNSSVEFSFWLKLLHFLLVLPQLCSVFLPHMVVMEGSLLYGVLAVIVIPFHLLSDTHFVYPFPTTDCQLSIGYDLVLCSLITLYAIHSHTHSLLKVSVACVLLPVISPAGVLALFLMMIHSEGLHSRLVTYIQRTVAQYSHSSSSSTSTSSSSMPLWMNLGLGWGVDHAEYSKACMSLAHRLGEALLEPGDGVLSCGCGYGAELLYWKEKFDLAHITGVDSNEEAARNFPLGDNIRLLHLPVSQLRQKFEHNIPVNKILALDSIYHFHDKPGFFDDCMSLLKAGGAVGVTDLVHTENTIPHWLLIMLRCMNISVGHLWTKEKYIEYLESSGWVDISVESLHAPHVLGQWFPSQYMNHLDYVLVTARRPAEVGLPPRPTVAVVGSGLSGLTAAHLLSGTHDVTIIEANDSGGLSGEGVEIYGQTVDIPLRIIGKGYYNDVEKLARSLDIELGPIRDDYLTQQNYGDNGPCGTPVSFSYTHSWFFNMISSLPHVVDMYRFHRSVYHDREITVDETWGEWMDRHGYNVQRYCESTRVDKLSNAEMIGEDGVSTTSPNHSSFIMWMMMGQASWMLSCSYQQVIDYPASIILAFIKSLGLGGDVGDAIHSSSSRSGRMMRIRPSMKALENALTFGVKTKYGLRVKGVGPDKVIDDVKYDYIVIATEASAVKHILSPSLRPDVFSRVQYQPSSIYLHTDETLMPEKKEDWRVFNICQQKGESMCMLTAWLNEYYPDSRFPTNVFQTWNPHKTPNNVLKVCNFLRVVHTSETRSILAEIDELQGVHGIYYAGAYSVEGMGLLEQAAKSGRKVADMIKNALDIAHTSGVSKDKSSKISSPNRSINVSERRITRSMTKKKKQRFV